MPLGYEQMRGGDDDNDDFKISSPDVGRMVHEILKSKIITSTC